MNRTPSPPFSPASATPEDLELYSSAVTLSDMELFVFPDLLYSLVLANLLSPRIWAWRDDPWFDGIESMNPHRRVQRLKQYIMDHYDFNLDLTTWGLTSSTRELERFRPFIDESVLRDSNALFGYEGDSYYFDLDIRKHFGLDAFTPDAIPYWKTETVEAMDAFVHRPGYARGAGECVSLATLYAAALFIVCRIPLEDVFLMATPLHSQNFLDVHDGILTNNRRVVTRNMWFNGTELTARAQRALRNEQITIVAHPTGYIHLTRPEATIDPEAYRRFQDGLHAYLQTEITGAILCNFLRQHSRFQKCFQLQHSLHGTTRYVALESVYAYEHSSPYRVGDSTRDKLLDEMDEYLFFSRPLPGRIVLNEFDAFLRDTPIDVDHEETIQQLRERFTCTHATPCEIAQALVGFARLEPRFPDAHTPHTFTPSTPVNLHVDMTREDITRTLESLRTRSQVADLAFYAGRDLARSHWTPFLKAAFERNPVCVEGAASLSDHEAASTLDTFDPTSTYDESRLAQPDEVWNARRGDGIERAITLAAILAHRYPQAPPRITLDHGEARVTHNGHHWTWPSSKPVAPLDTHPDH